MLGANIKIQKGSVFVHRVFDVAHEIDLNLAEKQLSEVQGKGRLKLVRDPYKAIIMREAPLTLDLGEDTLIGQNKEELKILCSAKIWHYGVVAITLQVPLVAGISFKDLVKLGAFLDDAHEVTAFASAKKDLVFKQIDHAVKSPWQNDIVEDYTTYLLEKISLPQLNEGQDPEQVLLNSEAEGVQSPENKSVEIKDPKELLKRVPIPELILGEDKFTLAEQNRKDILSNYHQYTNKDLLILDWNSAVIIDFTGEEFYRDYIDILEFSLTHLLELRVYDTLLDDKVATLYDSIEQKRGRMFTNRYSDLAEDAGQIYIEFSEFFERIDNSLKTVGDYHLAKVFRSATKKFRFEDWQQNIKEKLESLAKTSEILQGEVNSTRSHLMEFIILVMIAIEVIPIVYNWYEPIANFFSNLIK